MNDEAIEQEIQAKGLTAPRVTPADIEANIASEHYFTANDGVIGREFDMGLVDEPYEHEVRSLGLLTFCVLVLRNGFAVTGESASSRPSLSDRISSPLRAMAIRRPRLSTRVGRSR